jgi:ADP-ribose pyrophosphatase
VSDSDRFRTVASRTIFDVAFLSLQIRDVETSTGDRVERIVITHPGAVAVVPCIGEDVVLIEQYRAAADDYVLEIPAGKLDDPDHDKSDTARRELLEETGLVAGELTWMTEIWTTVGFTDERIAIFRADVVSEGERAPVGLEEESARVVRMPLVEAVRHVREGTISDAKSAIGLLLAFDEHRSAP